MRLVLRSPPPPHDTHMKVEGGAAVAEAAFCNGGLFGTTAVVVEGGKPAEVVTVVEAVS